MTERLLCFSFLYYAFGDESQSWCYSLTFLIYYSIYMCQNHDILNSEQNSSFSSHSLIQEGINCSVENLMILWHHKANDVSGDEEQWGLTHKAHGYHGSVNWVLGKWQSLCGSQSLYSFWIDNDFGERKIRIVIIKLSLLIFFASEKSVIWSEKWHFDNIVFINRDE